MRSSKWHAHGNVYLLLEEAELTPARARDLARGTDGIVEVLDVAGARAEVAIWNPDGSRAEMSGNGTRIAARWLAERSGSDVVGIAVGDRTVRGRLLDNGDVETSFDAIVVGAPETAGGIRFTPVSVGNPHAVVVGDPDDITRIGPLLETHPRFPERTNVQVARVEAPARVRARVWERGVGETTASGTSAIAVAAATRSSAGDHVAVSFPGGDLHVRLEGDRAYLTGPAERME